MVALQNSNRKKKILGFSLIEIMTVIAIIGVLLTLSAVSFTKVRQNSANKTRETQVKTFAAALENDARYNDTPLTCTSITEAPAVTANRLDLRESDLADPKSPSETRVSCNRKPRDASSDSFFVSGLGCPQISIEYLKDGSTERGVVTVKGPVETGQACITPNPDGV